MNEWQSNLQVSLSEIETRDNDEMSILERSVPDTDMHDNMPILDHTVQEFNKTIVGIHKTNEQVGKLNFNDWLKQSNFNSHMIWIIV